MADHVAREIVSREVQKIINEEKELKVNEVRPVEEIEKILPEDDEKEDVEREVKHIDLKA
jgi:ribosomal protein L25 (general stress protein Ctc)